MTYAEKLRNPLWQRKRLEILDRDRFECVECGDSTSTLHVDHKLYRKGKDPWEYGHEELQTLCAKCHVDVENERTALKERMSTFNNGTTAVMTGFAEGMLFLTKAWEPGYAVNLDSHPHICGFIAAVSACEFPNFRGREAEARIIGCLKNGKAAASELLSFMRFEPYWKGDAK